MKQITMYTDGACRGNPGPGGWGVWLQCEGQSRELKGAEEVTTNNRMELTAVIMGLEALIKPVSVNIITDSKYVMDGMSKWIHNWKRKAWRTASGQPVKNVDLWQRLDAALAPHQVKWQWVKGHSGVPGNERVDALANIAIDEMQQGG